MRRRAFVPDVPTRLEGRALLSGPAGLSRDPVHLSGLGFDTTINRMRFDFGEYASSGNFPRLRAELQQVVVAVPFGRVDGLGPAINGILARMRQGIASGALRPRVEAYQEVAATARADVQARIDDGSIVVVH